MRALPKAPYNIAKPVMAKAMPTDNINHRNHADALLLEGFFTKEL
jgi:hypothetical protein